MSLSTQSCWLKLLLILPWLRCVLLKMETIVQGHKRSKCFMINPMDGTPQMAPTFTREEQESFSISKLELWKKCDVDLSTYDVSAVIDPYHAKLRQFEGRSVTLEKTIKSDSEVDAASKRKKAIKDAIEHANKAAVELSMLAQLASLLNTGKILSLQTFQSDQLRRTMESGGDQDNKAAAPTISENWNLPIAQRIEFQRETMKKATSRIAAGLIKCQSLVQQRQGFANTVMRCQEEDGITLCFVDTRTGRRVRHRRYDAKRDYLAVDCSVAVPAWELPSIVESERTMGATRPGSLANKRPLTNATAGASSAASVVSAESSTGMYTKNAYVPIVLGAAGLELTESERTRTQYTLRCQVLLSRQDTASSSKEAASLLEVCWTDLWSLLSAPIITTEVGAVAQFSTHCQRRKHEILCHILLERLQSESQDCASQWDVLSATSTSPAVALRAENKGALKQALREDKLASTLVVVERNCDKMVIRLSDSLFLKLALVPNQVDEVTSSGAMDVVANDVSANQNKAEDVCPEQSTLKKAISRVLLQAVLGLLSGPLTPSEGGAERDAQHQHKGFWDVVAAKHKAGLRERAHPVQLVLQMQRTLRDTVLSFRTAK